MMMSTLEGDVVTEKYTFVMPALEFEDNKVIPMIVLAFVLVTFWTLANVTVPSMLFDPKPTNKEDKEGSERIEES